MRKEPTEPSSRQIEQYQRSTTGGDVIELVSPLGNVTGISYGDAEEGLALAWSQGDWSWTTTPTPGLPNRITQSAAQGANTTSSLIIAPDIDEAAAAPPSLPPPSAPVVLDMQERVLDGSSLAAALRSSEAVSSSSPASTAGIMAGVLFGLLAGATVFVLRRLRRPKEAKVAFSVDETDSNE